jgi:branched-chain amino acid transport system ATP-binding protein
MKELLLQLKDASVHYGGVHALDGASVVIDEGEVVALMGPNGAGKSTILKALFGIAPLSQGQVLWHGSRVEPVSHEMVARGISFVPQGRRVFGDLTVRENLEIAGIVVRDKKVLQGRIEEAMAIFPILREKRDAKAGSLSGGQQQMLALARGLMTDPKVLLLDEPSLGLAPKVVREVFEKIREINERHKTAVFIVEHNIKSLLAIVHRGYVLDKGKVLIHGSASELMHSETLKKLFVGALE